MLARTHASASAVAVKEKHYSCQPAQQVEILRTADRVQRRRCHQLSRRSPADRPSPGTIYTVCAEATGGTVHRACRQDQCRQWSISSSACHPSHLHTPTSTRSGDMGTWRTQARWKCMAPACPFRSESMPVRSSSEGIAPCRQAHGVVRVASPLASKGHAKETIAVPLRQRRRTHQAIPSPSRHTGCYRRQQGTRMFHPGDERARNLICMRALRTATEVIQPAPGEVPTFGSRRFLDRREGGLVGARLTLMRVCT